MPTSIAITRNFTPATSRSDSTTPKVEGTYYLFGNGTPEKPIVIKGAGDGEVVFDGGGNFNLFNVKAANYNYFEGLTFRNTEIAIWAGTEFQSGSVRQTSQYSHSTRTSIWPSSQTSPAVAITISPTTVSSAATIPIT